jgi:hypothetical protein
MISLNTDEITIQNEKLHIRNKEVRKSLLKLDGKSNKYSGFVTEYLVLPSKM